MRSAGLAELLQWGEGGGTVVWMGSAGLAELLQWGGSA